MKQTYILHKHRRAFHRKFSSSKCTRRQTTPKCKAFPWHSSLAWLSEAPTFLAVFEHWTRVGSVESAWWPSDAQAYDEATLKFRPASVVWQVVMASLWGRQRSFCFTNISLLAWSELGFLNWRMRFWNLLSMHILPHRNCGHGMFVQWYNLVKC